MSVLDWIVAVVLFVVALSSLITIHELGHLSMAKLFNVYCQEFSIGFGPALIHKRKKGGETYFSLRAIPFGGYVSMYGEGVELEPGAVIPEERSLEGIKKWKKSIILVAGVVLNAILAFVLIAISNLAFPRIVTTKYASIAKDSVAASVLKDDDLMKSYHNKHVSYEYTDKDKIIHAGQFYMVDNTVEIGEGKYAICYAPTGTKYFTKFTDGITIYPTIAGEKIATKNEDNTYTVINKPLYDAYVEVDGGINAEFLYADFTQSAFKAAEGVTFEAHLKFARYNETTKKYDEVVFNPTIKAVKSGDKFVWEDIGLSFQTMDDKDWTFSDKWKQTFKDYGTASIAVFKGIGTLFTGGIKNMSGIVGIFDMTANLYGSYTFATYLYFWGLISVNLAIFNLLPFPGLDGFALLITIIEGITRKKVPTKVKGIMSAVGLVLLFSLMIAIVVLDIIKLV